MEAGRGEIQGSGEIKEGRVPDPATDGWGGGGDTHGCWCGLQLYMALDVMD